MHRHKRTQWHRGLGLSVRSETRGSWHRTQRPMTNDYSIFFIQQLWVQTCSRQKKEICDWFNFSVFDQRPPRLWWRRVSLVLWCFLHWSWSDLIFTVSLVFKQTVSNKWLTFHTQFYRFSSLMQPVLFTPYLASKILIKVLINVKCIPNNYLHLKYLFSLAHCTKRCWCKTPSCKIKHSLLTFFWSFCGKSHENLRSFQVSSLSAPFQCSFPRFTDVWKFKSL